jgi:uncharacterized protein
MKKVNILLIGGTGFIGMTLSAALHDAGHGVTIISRRPPTNPSLPKNSGFVRADISIPGQWQNIVPDFDVVINLAGVSIFRRWNVRGKQQILESRIFSTRNIVDSLLRSKGKLQSFFSVSGVGYYGFHRDEVLTEEDPGGTDFLAGVAARWEEEAGRVREIGIRPVMLRLGHVLGAGGGVLPRLVKLANLHLASRWGSGKQWISWIHEKDFAGAVISLLENPSVSGPVNICSPHPVRNMELMQLLSTMVGRRPFIPPVPEFVLRLMTGEFASVFLNGQRVFPGKLTSQGFKFEYPNLKGVLSALLNPSDLK